MGLGAGGDSGDSGGGYEHTPGLHKGGHKESFMKRKKKKLKDIYSKIMRRK
jgi:hypothetical protein